MKIVATTVDRMMKVTVIKSNYNSRDNNIISDDDNGWRGYEKKTKKINGQTFHRIMLK